MVFQGAGKIRNQRHQQFLRLQIHHHEGISRYRNGIYIQIPANRLTMDSRHYVYIKHDLLLRQHNDQASLTGSHCGLATGTNE